MLTAAVWPNQQLCRKSTGGQDVPHNYAVIIPMTEWRHLAGDTWLQKHQATLKQWLLSCVRSFTSHSYSCVTKLQFKSSAQTHGSVRYNNFIYYLETLTWRRLVCVYHGDKIPWRGGGGDKAFSRKPCQWIIEMEKRSSCSWGLELMMNKQEKRWKGGKKQTGAARKPSEVSVLKEIQTLTTTSPD